MHRLIETSATRKGEYVGYCDGVQRIRKTPNGWETYSLGSSSGTFHLVSGRTLTELGNKLSKIALNLKPA